MDPTTDFYLVRHGTTAYNDPNDPQFPGVQLRGFKEVPLGDRGIAETHKVAKKLPKAKVILASPLTRTRQTAEIIQQHTGGDIQLDEHMLPWHIGDFAGKNVEDVGNLLEDYQRDGNRATPNGETFGDFYSRYSTGIQKLVALGSQFPGQIIGVGHGRNLDNLHHVLKSTDPRKNISYPSHPGDIVHVQHFADKGWQIKTIREKG